MKSNFTTLKNGKNSENVWANPTSKEIYPANKNCFGFNALKTFDSFWDKYGKSMKVNQGKSDCTKFFYSAKSMNESGFQLVKRGDSPLW